MKIIKRPNIFFDLIFKCIYSFVTFETEVSNTPMAGGNNEQFMLKGDASRVCLGCINNVHAVCLLF